MLMYARLWPRPSWFSSPYMEWWHPADQEELFATPRVPRPPSDSIISLAFWLGADADSISDASLHHVPATLATDHYMWGGADMEPA